jgi:predicted RNA binding protein YcfA (HicA-like mRNA interferase family)
MKVPRDLSAGELAKALARFGYEVTRQKGSHLRLTTHTADEHHITLPNHPSLRIGVVAFSLTFPFIFVFHVSN